MLKRIVAVFAASGLFITGAAGAADEPGFRTSQPSMLTPIAPGATALPIMNVGERLRNGYMMESIPDGISMRPRSEGRVDVFLNHELSLVPFPFNAMTGVGLSDFSNAMLSHLVLNQGNVTVREGRYAIPSDANYQRFCSNFLAGAAQGFERELLFTNEEASDLVNRTGTAWPAGPNAEQAGVVVVYDVATRTYRSVYGMGRMNHENAVAVPGFGHPVIVTGDDTFVAPSSQLYMYTAANADAVWNDRGTLWAFKSDDPNVNDYSDMSGNDKVTGRFIEVPRSVAVGDQTALEAWSNANNVFQFIRVEDIAYDRNRPHVVYFADTGEPRAQPGPGPARMTRGATGNGPFPNGRVFKMELDRNDPKIVTALRILIEGDPDGAASAKNLRYIHNPDNLEATGKSLLIQEDPGSQNQYPASDPNGTTARIWRLNLANGELRPVARVNQAQDPNASQGAWESSGIVDASSFFGPGAFLLDIQAHTIFVEQRQVGGLTFKREAGQLLLFRLPGA